MNFRPFLPLTAVGLISLAFSACQDHKPSIDTFGQIDTAMVAADTAMQVNMDRSYEYQRTFAEGDTVAYDFLAYDKPKGSSNPEWESKFILIRRDRIRADTVAKSVRSNPVRASWMSDMDNNGRREFFFYEFPKTAVNGWVELYAYESNGHHAMTRIETPLKNDRAHYHGSDTFFVSGDHLIRLAPFYKTAEDSVPSGHMQQSYKLMNEVLLFDKESIR